MDNSKVFAMKFSKVCPLLAAKAEKKGPTVQEVKEIEDPLMQRLRYFDKLADELAKGKPMEKILRK